MLCFQENKTCKNIYILLDGMSVCLYLKISCTCKNNQLVLLVPLTHSIHGYAAGAVNIAHLRADELEQAEEIKS